ncbi:hypothetical protein Pmani_033692 [Petrolisthes manimaculis]|uniref:Elongation of very long chain fatty acids protein n=2 Tax=Petrolisthes manimaculis TaxID=1843537 RepID=A0AAE1NQF1_9EUCA|nr:hypothetical protein Pmani_033692 [Petrolisthes manimaculis]
MYLYYLLAAMGPKVRPYLWWKKYLTKLQMAQFITMMVHASVSVVSGCQAGAPLMRIILVMAAIFQILFTDFYIKAYLNRTSGKTKKIASPVFCNTLNNFQQQPATPSPISLHKKINSEMKVEEENQGEIRHRCSRVD